MSEKELNDAIDLEINWLKYYASLESRTKINLNNGSIYDQLVSIGYTKKIISLDKRCAFLRVTSDFPINSNTKIDQIFSTDQYRNNDCNIFTALEYYIITNPKFHDKIYNKLN